MAWNLDAALTPRFDPADAVGMTPAGGKLGTLLGRAIDSRLMELAAAKPTSGRVVEIELNAVESQVVGVATGNVVRILAVPADTLPEELWDQLLERRQVTLVTELDGDTVTATTVLVDGTADNPATQPSSALPMVTSRSTTPATHSRSSCERDPVPTRAGSGCPGVAKLCGT